VSVPEWL